MTADAREVELSSIIPQLEEKLEALRSFPKISSLPYELTSIDKQQIQKCVCKMGSFFTQIKLTFQLLSLSSSPLLAGEVLNDKVLDRVEKVEFFCLSWISNNWPLLMTISDKLCSLLFSQSKLTYYFPSLTFNTPCAPSLNDMESESPAQCFLSMPQTESRKAIKSPQQNRTFVNQQKIRDEFFHILRHFTSSSSAVVDRGVEYKKEISFKTKALFEKILRENYEWFADLFVSELIIYCTASQDHMFVANENAAAMKMNKLQQRMNKFKSGSQIFTSHEEIFIDFMDAADSNLFIDAVRDSFMNSFSSVLMAEKKVTGRISEFYFKSKLLAKFIAYTATKTCKSSLELFFIGHCFVAWEAKRLVCSIPAILEGCRVLCQKFTLQVLPSILYDLQMKLNGKLSVLSKQELYALLSIEYFLSTINFVNDSPHLHLESFKDLKFVMLPNYPPIEEIPALDLEESFLISDSFDFPFLDFLLSLLTFPSKEVQKKQSIIRRKIQPKIQISKTELQFLQTQKQLRKWFLWKYPEIKEIIQFSTAKLASLIFKNFTLSTFDVKAQKAHEMAIECRSNVEIIMKALLPSDIEPKVLVIAVALNLESIKSCLIEKMDSVSTDRAFSALNE